MKNSIKQLLVIMTFFSMIFYSCTPDVVEINEPEILEKEQSFSFKKVFPIADVTGKNTATLLIESVEEKFIEEFDENSFVLTASSVDMEAFSQTPASANEDEGEEESNEVQISYTITNVSLQSDINAYGIKYVGTHPLSSQIGSRAALNNSQQITSDYCVDVNGTNRPTEGFLGTPGDCNRTRWRFSKIDGGIFWSRQYQAYSSNDNAFIGYSIGDDDLGWNRVRVNVRTQRRCDMCEDYFDQGNWFPAVFLVSLQTTCTQ